MIDVAAIERLDDKAKLVLFVFTFLGDEHSASNVSEAMGKAVALPHGTREANALCQRLCSGRILRCVQGFRYGSDYYYKLVDKFSPLGVARLLEVSIVRNWWKIFGYDDSVAHADGQSIREFGKGLSHFDSLLQRHCSTNSQW